MDHSSSSSTSSQHKGLVPQIYEEREQQQQERNWWFSTPPSAETRAEGGNQERGEGDNDIGDEGDNNLGVIEREHMFDKAVTPSDVGKLNRLVIPKQHAEKYFPLDSSGNEKGLLLNFEDRTGKSWRFRYSYWNSSQSYVMTKGWSRFVKEKKLDAGDVVSFQRGVGERGKDKLYIDWRRRPDAPLLLSPPPSNLSLSGHPAGSAFFIHRNLPPAPPPTFLLRSHHPHYYSPQGIGTGTVWDHPNTHLSPMNSNVMSMDPSHPHPHRRGTVHYYSLPSGTGHYAYGYPNVVNPSPATGSLRFLGSSSSSAPHPHLSSSSADHQGVMLQAHGEERGAEPIVFESVPVVQGKAAAKRLRLFGVNMECPISHQGHDHYEVLSAASASSSTTQQQHATVAMARPSLANQHPLPLQFRLYNGTPLMPADFLDKAVFVLP